MREIENEVRSLHPSESELLGEDLEQAYQRALQANEAVECEIGQQLDEHAKLNVVDHATSRPTDPSDNCFGDHQSVVGDIARSVQGSGIEYDAATESRFATTSEPSAASVEVQRDVSGETAGILASRITPMQVIEAALFVGGTPLTTKRIRLLLRAEYDQDFVERTVGELNHQYATEGRPYEITFGEGGYRMALRPEFESVRSRVYGLGPKEVRLSQDALEVLALVAYQQPITRQRIEEQGRNNSGIILRQLLRRELITIERNQKSRKDVRFRTTPRFLSLFGLGRLDELPRADDLNFK